MKKIECVASTLPRDNDAVLLERLFGLDHQLLKQQAAKSGDFEVLISDESARWLTFLLSKMIFDPFRVQVQQNPALLSSMLQDRLSDIQSKKIRTIKPLKHLDSIQIKSMGLGNFYPSIDSYQLCYDSEIECCAFRIKCSWQDVITLDMESALSLIGLIALPFSVSIKLKTLRFTAQLQSSKDGESFEITCLTDDNLLIDLEIGSLVGHRTKLKDLPKIKHAIIEAVKKLLLDILINPKCIKIPLPKLESKSLWSISGQNGQEESTQPEELSCENNSEHIVVDKEIVEVDESIALETRSISMMNPSSLTGKSLISDESEPMNVFLDSRYDFDEDIESEVLMSGVKTK